MDGIALLLLSLVSVSEGETHVEFLEGCSSHCSSKFDENLSCWNKTTQFFNKILLGAFFRYVTTQKSIDRIMEYMERNYFNNDSVILTTELINRTIMAFVSTAFETIKTKKQFTLLPCPKGCERPSNFWLSSTFISLLLSAILTTIIIIKTLKEDRMDQNYGVIEETAKTDETLCLVVVCTEEVDTYGRDFIFVYPPNNSGSSGMNATLSIINPDTRHHANVTIEYPEFNTIGDKITVIRHTTISVVKVMSRNLLNFHKSVILDNITNGLRSYLDARIVVHSTIPITLIANSMDVYGAQDSFLVLPISMAGNHYAFTLPASSSSGSTLIYFLPVKAEPNQYITINFVHEAFSSSCKYTAKVGKMLVFSLSGKSVTFWARSNFTFIIVAAVRGLPTKKKSNILDFGCFMPSPMPTMDCDKLSVRDSHVTPLLTGKYYFLTPPSFKCGSVEISIYGSNKAVKTKHLLSTSIQSSNPVILDEYGNMAAISTTIMLNVIRYGGYNVGALNYEEGGYLHEVPTISQFITGMIPIIVPSDSNQITVIADYKAMSSAFFDGEISLSFTVLPFLHNSLYYATGTVSSGFHFFYADGLYIIFITGRTNNSAYGYIPAFNSRKVVKINSTTSESFAFCIASLFDDKN
ncbi:unnamed protein product [Cercopithifilaria johnstoni]|uniref:IgGFc-binding protein N-terminal domain-containing protein n=1 Tax=Cercopithifilaria johnstoni TaxID=2874296 RepID=A0A8J2M8J8_9BILA|nr:unnamed protein product [Cercopithifilaria johnstoni]